MLNDRVKVKRSVTDTNMYELFMNRFTSDAIPFFCRQVAACLYASKLRMVTALFFLKRLLF